MENGGTDSMLYKNEIKSVSERQQKYLGNRNSQKMKKKESQGDDEEADSLNL